MNETHSCHNPTARFPLCLSVPHAGRRYPAWIDDALAVPLAGARGLEDRYVEVLVDCARARGHMAIIAHTPRLVIDLNRAETDFDPAHVRGLHIGGARPSVRARGGLGLVPDRLATTGRLWRQPLSASELTTRITTLHRPYHAALADMLARAKARHGVAVLLDLHSMPTLHGADAADVVIGDLHGRAAAPQLVEAAAALFARHGLRVAINVPYAGGHILERHARPAGDVHGMQVEIDRRLYLDSKRDLPGEGAARMGAIIAELADMLATLAPSLRAWPIAAE